MTEEGEQAAALRRLLALEDIRQLAISYALAFDLLDWGLMESLWIDTEAPEKPPILDIHAIRRLPEKYAGAGPSLFVVSNHRIELLDADHASGSVYCIAQADRGRFFQQAIVYLDDYERQDGRWLFRRRNHLLLWGHELSPNPMSLPAAHWPHSQIGSSDGSAVWRGMNGAGGAGSGQPLADLDQQAQ